VINGYGGIYDITDADVRPDPNMKYKIAIDLSNAPKNRKDVNYFLERVARMMNLHVVGGVPPENLQVVVVAHAGATYSVLSDEKYQEEFGSENPNAELLSALHDAGVQLMVCGQSIRGRDIRKEQLHPDVRVATSMLTAITTLQMQGYAMMKF
jgi:intracellular sulfur oxidation DsrE/DsrF family protein